MRCSQIIGSAMTFQGKSMILDKSDDRKKSPKQL